MGEKGAEIVGSGIPINGSPADVIDGSGVPINGSPADVGELGAETIA